MSRPGVSWPPASLLGRLPELARSALVELGVGVRFAASRQIMRVGEPGGRAFLLLNGFVKVLGNSDGREPLLAVRVGGDLVGEMAVLTGGTRSATVVTCSETSAREISGVELRNFLCAQPQVSFALASMLAERLRWANQRRVDFAAAGAGARVSRVLVALLEQYGHETAAGRDMGVSLTQEEIASLAGVRLATAEKTLRALAQAGIVRLGYRHVVATDLARLRATADSEASDS